MDLAKRILVLANLVKWFRNASKREVLIVLIISTAALTPCFTNGFSVDLGFNLSVNFSATIIP